MLEPYALTKVDLAALRQMDDLVVQRYRNRGGEIVDRVECIRKVQKTEANPWVTEQIHRIEAPIRIRDDSWTMSKLDLTDATAFAMLGNYKHTLTTFTSALATLRAGDEIHFEFHPDYHSTQYLAEIGVHCDVLMLHVRRGEKRIACWEIQQSTCPDNTARMVRGIRPKREPEYALITAETA